jgi:hypothetical protein
MTKGGELQAYSFVYQQRRRKVHQLMKSALSILFDKVTLLYLTPLFIGALFILKESLLEYEQYFKMMNGHMYAVSIFFALFIHVFYRLKSLVDPRFKVTSSDFNLSLLTYDTEKIVRLIIAHEQVKRMGYFAVLLLLLRTFHIVSWSLLLLLFVSFIVMDSLTGIMQWRNYQKRIGQWMIHTAAGFGVIGLFLLLYVLFLRDIPLAAYIVLNGCCLMLIAYLLRKEPLTSQVKWDEVILIGDDKTWNLLIVKLITGVGFNMVPRRIRLSNPNRKKGQNERIPYEASHLLFTYWKKYFMGNKTLAFNLIVNASALYLFIRMNVDVFPGLYVLFPSLLMIYLLRGILKTRLHSIQFQVIPWGKDEQVAAFSKSTCWLFGLLSILHFIFSVIHSTTWMVGLVVLAEYIVTYFIYSYILTLTVSASLKKRDSYKPKHVLAVFLYISAITAIEYIPLLSMFILMAYLMKRYQKVGLTHVVMSKSR